MIRLQNKLGFAFACLWLGFIGLLASVEQPAAQEKSFIWQVRSNAGTTYLLGSIHLLKKEHYPLKKVIDDTFAKAKKLLFEIDINSSSPEKVQQLMLQKGIASDGTTLQQSISKETYSLAADRVKELGLDLGALSLFKPWLAALTIQSLKLQRLGLDINFGVDRYLARRAEKAGKPTAGLETAEFQIGLFDQLSLRDQELMLRETLKQVDFLDQGADRIVDSWLAGDAKSLEELLLAGMREYPEVHQKLVIDRNRRWLPKIEQAIRQRELTMVVVGAAHLVGQDGLLALLKGRGYRVEQL